MKVIFVCSNGGHLLQLFQLRECVPGDEQIWVTFPTLDAKSILKGKNVVYAYYPTNRSFVNFIRNLLLAVRLIAKEKPTHVISTGAGIAMPFFIIARMFGIKTCFIESFARVFTPSLSGRLCYRLSTRFIYQWKELENKYPRGQFGGSIY